MNGEYHAHHGPQPDDEAMDSSWLAELDKFLSGQENNLKEHKMYVDYNFQYKDKSYPTSDMAHDLMTIP
jgi:hypothetical protein